MLAKTTNHYVLGGVLALLALNAVAGAVYGMAGASGVPREWLEGSPFTSFLVPSLFLLVVVGGSAAVASFGVLSWARWARPAAMLAGATAVMWIGVQVAVIGFVSWLQPIVALAGAMIVSLACGL